MQALVIMLLVMAAAVAVALLWVYIAVFVEPRARSTMPNPVLDLEHRATEHRLKERLRDTLPHGGPVDPVCGQDAALDGLHSCAYKGHVYYFCSEKCRDRFAQHPQAYLSETGVPLVRPLRSFAHFR